MPTYVVGDIQGCYEALQRLLERVRFDPAFDRLWCVGDIVNRGPNSLAVLRLLREMGSSAVCVLGNHDLHLLAMSQGNRRNFRFDTAQQVLDAPDSPELLDWLRRRPLIHHDAVLGFTLVHAGLPPQWDLYQALSCAAELEAVLRGDGFRNFCMNMYGNEPRLWSNDLGGLDRLRFITNSLTRLRYCDLDGRITFGETGAPGTQHSDHIPWFRIPWRASRDARIVFGHWSTLGYLAEDNVWAIDTGCLWGGQLTALRLGEPPTPTHLPCPETLHPG